MRAHDVFFPILASYLTIPTSEDPSQTNKIRERSLDGNFPQSSLEEQNRRKFLRQSSIVIGAFCAPGQAAFGDVLSSSTSNDDSRTGATKPFAPTSALLPATRVKLWIEDAHSLSEKLAASSTSDDTAMQYLTLKELNNVLSHRPNLFDPKKGEKPLSRVSSTAFAQFTAKNGNDKVLGDNTKTGKDSVFSAFATSPGERIASALNRADVDRQWGMLQSQESKKELENEVRAAFNFYTQQLEFNSNSYAWNGSVAERKRLIRNDQIPTTASVIASDLDLRDLYRNQLLTALDDVTAEVAYQNQLLEGETKGSGKPNSEIDFGDTIDLMNQVYVACTKWFDMIDQKDVENALKILQGDDI